MRFLKSLWLRIVGEPKTFRNARFVGPHFSVIESKPAKRVVFFSGQPHYLAFPYVYFVISYTKVGVYKFQSLFVYFSPYRLSDSGQETYQLLLPNIATNGVCLGNHWVRADLTIKELCEAVVNRFWQSSFEGMPRRLESWHEATRKDDLSALLIRGKKMEAIPYVKFDN